VLAVVGGGCALRTTVLALAGAAALGVRAGDLGAWKEQGIGALVWDNAPAHTAKLVRSAGMALSFLPPFSPELNPAERVFEEVRRWVEGRVYDSLEAMVSAVESFLSELAGDAERVCRLAGWDWVVESLKERTNPVPQNTA
jgi:transposase